MVVDADKESERKMVVPMEVQWIELTVTWMAASKMHLKAVMFVLMDIERVEYWVFEFESVVMWGAESASSLDLGRIEK